MCAGEMLKNILPSFSPKCCSTQIESIYGHKLKLISLRNSCGDIVMDPVVFNYFHII